MKSLADIIRDNLRDGKPLSEIALAELRKQGRTDALRINASNILRLIYEGKKVTEAQRAACAEFFPDQAGKPKADAPAELQPLACEIDTGTPLKSPKQEAFAQAVASGMEYSAAYRKVYNAERMQPKSVWECACKLAADPKVAPRIETLKRAAAAHAVITAREFNERLTRRFRQAEAEGDLDGMAKIGTLMTKTIPGLQVASKVEVKDGGVTEDYTPRNVKETPTDDLLKIINGFSEGGD
jgi:hypothetical protein